MGAPAAQAPLPAIRVTHPSQIYSVATLFWSSTPERRANEQAGTGPHSGADAAPTDGL